MRSWPSTGTGGSTDPDAVDVAVAGHDVIVNCAVWTAVDDAEVRAVAAFAVMVAPGARIGHRPGREHVVSVAGRPLTLTPAADFRSC